MITILFGLYFGGKSPYVLPSRIVADKMFFRDTALTDMLQCVYKSQQHEHWPGIPRTGIQVPNLC